MFVGLLSPTGKKPCVQMKLQKRTKERKEKRKEGGGRRKQQKKKGGEGCANPLNDVSNEKTYLDSYSSNSTYENARSVCAYERGCGKRHGIVFEGDPDS